MGHVLKANRVRFDEPVRLGAAGAATVEKATARSQQAQPRVRIFECNQEYAILEVVCSCGEVVHVRCDYASASAVAGKGPGQP